MGFAAHIVYAWTRLYTWRLPPRDRDDRQREIMSDLWESHEDSDRRRRMGLSAHVLGRMIAGIPDDLLWRCEHARGQFRRPGAVIAVIVACVVLVGAALWVVDLAQVGLPQPPKMVRAMPHPP